MSLYLNNHKISKLEIENNKYYKKYKSSYIQPNNNIINITTTNSLKIIDKNEVIYEFNMNPIAEDFENVMNSLNDGEYRFNMDMYEDLVPLKYSVIKKNNNLFLYSIEHTIF